MCPEVPLTNPAGRLGFVRGMRFVTVVPDTDSREIKFDSKWHSLKAGDPVIFICPDTGKFCRTYTVVLSKHGVGAIPNANFVRVTEAPT